jgi:REP element-mobilizing transposase RayT
LCGDSRHRLSGRAKLAFLARKEIPTLEQILSTSSLRPESDEHEALESNQRSFAPRTAEGGCPHMVLAMPQAFCRRQLPHLQVDDKPHFVTFCTDRRWILPESARSVVLECCFYDIGKKFDLKAAVVMPDHVHLIFMPLIDYQAMEVCSLAKIMDAIKGASAHKINKALNRKGRVWQPESFDHVLRCSGNLDAKIQYLLENPVRRGLVRNWHDYPWLWQKVYVNPFARPVIS